MIKLYSKTVDNCRICSSKLEQIINLGKQPPANSLRDLKSKKIKPIDLILTRCSKCKTLQLSETVSKKYLFENYVWVTGTSKAAQVFSKRFYDISSKRLNNKKRYVLEIASNDGTFLETFKKNKYNIIGIDAAKNICKIANTKKIFTINDFFNEKTAKKIKQKYNFANFIFARNVIPHVENIKNVLSGISLLMDKKTIGCIEFHYVDNIIKENQYDSIYHEHIFYFSIYSLMGLLKKFNLNCFDIEESPISGGSLIIFFSKSNLKKTNQFLKKINNEINDKINNIKTLQRFSKNCIHHKELFQSLIIKCSHKYKNIYGYGASARSSTLLNFANISKEIKGIFDKNPLKLNKYTAGSNIFIQDIKNIKNLKPDLIIVLAWNFTNEIMNELEKKYDYTGDYLIPIPKPMIIKK